jgi:hypothetical protein
VKAQLRFRGACVLCLLTATLALLTFANAAAAADAGVNIAPTEGQPFTG